MNLSGEWVVRELDAQWDAEWDRLAGATPESGFMQSSSWLTFKRAEGYRAWRFGLLEKEQLRGGGTFYWYPGAAQDGFLICPEGPVLPWPDPGRCRDGLRLLIETAR